MLTRKAIAIVCSLLLVVSAHAGGLLLLGVGSGGGYTPPPLVNNYAVAFGDSRTANGGGAGYGSGSFTATWTFNNGWAGWLGALGGGKIILGAASNNGDWNYGVGAQTTAGIAGRVSVAGNNCDDYGHYAAVCFNGSFGTASVSTGATSFAYTRTSTNDPVVGSYFSMAAGNYNTGCTIASITGSSPNFTITLNPPSNSILSASSCVTSGPGSTTVYFGPAAYASKFTGPLSTPGQGSLGSAGVGASVVDPDANISTTGANSPVNDPSQTVYVLGGVNDSNFSSASVSTANLGSILDSLGPSGANKFAVLADEVPTGLATGYSLTAAIHQNGGPEQITAAATVTLSQSANYYDTVQVFYTPAGSGPPFAAGANDGVQLINCVSGTTAASNTQTGVGSGACASSIPAGYYAVSAAGVMSFGTTDSTANAKVSVFYRYTASGATSSQLQTIHSWALGSATASRPWVSVGQTWEATVDSSTGSNYYPLPYVSVDGLHPGTAGGARVANAMVSAAQAAGAIYNNVPFPAPTVNNPNFNGTYYTSTGAVSWGSTSVCNGAPGVTYQTTQNYWVQSLTPNASTGIYGAAGSTPNALIFPNRTDTVTSGTHVVCVDVAHNALLLDHANTFTVATTTMVQFDPSSLISDGVFDHTNQITLTSATPITGCTAANCPVPVYSGQTFAQGYPLGWIPSLDTNSQNAIAAGTLMFRYGITSNNPFGDGADWFTVQLGGYAPTGGLTLTLTDTLMSFAYSQVATNEQHRSVCDVKIAAGPNGHLTGLNGAIVKSQEQNPAFTAPGQTLYTGSTIWSGQAGGGSMDFTDGVLSSGISNVSGGILSIKEITPPAKYVGSVGSGNPTINILVTATQGEPVSATVWFGHCQMLKAAS